MRRGQSDCSGLRDCFIALAMKKADEFIFAEGISPVNPKGLSYDFPLGDGKKKIKRIRYLNWVQGRVDFVPAYEMEIEDEEALKRKLELEEKVQQALNGLDPLEKRFIQYFYFECLPYEKIAELLNKRKYKLQRTHRKALNKLRIILKDFAQTRFKICCDSEKLGWDEGFSSVLDRSCILCQSPFKEEIDLLIRNKRREQTWKPLMRMLKEKYNLKIKTPQVLMGHQNNHMV